MDPHAIKDLASEIALHLPGYSWTQFAIQAALLMVAAAMGAFFGEYLRQRGQNLATRADFARLSQQLRANTELVEGIRSEVEQRNWVQREWATLRREKLELLLQKMDECDAFLDKLRRAAIEGRNLGESSAVQELATLGTLYFPELTDEIADLQARYRDVAMRSLDFAQEIMSAQSDPVALSALYQRQPSGLISDEYLVAMRTLRLAGRRVLLEIVGLPSEGT